LREPVRRRLAEVLVVTDSSYTGGPPGAWIYEGVHLLGLAHAGRRADLEGLTRLAALLRQPGASQEGPGCIA